MVDYLTRFVNETDALYISEAYAIILLPTILADPAETQYRTNLSSVFQTLDLARRRS